LELRIRRQLFAEDLRQPRLDLLDVTRQVGKFRVQLEVGDDALEREVQAVGAGIVDAVGRQQLFGFDVLGRDDRAYEDEVVVEISCGAGYCSTPS
jgi:hypothetical protein